MPPVKRKMHAYTEEAMQNALAEVQRGMRVATAAKLYEVPRVTLLYKAKGTTPPYRRMGPESILSPHEEHVLAEWIISVRKAGFHVSMNELFNSVQYMIINNKRPNPFKNNRPGRTWFVGFKRRNPRIIQYLMKARILLTKENVLRWFSCVSTYLEEKGKHINIFEDPTRIFNGDEVALFLNPKRNKGLLAKTDKNIYQFNSEESEYLTVFITGNANGDLLPPLIVFKDQFPDNITCHLPEKWGIGKTDSGWVNSDIFFNFITKVFQPYLVKENIKLPVILFVDAQKSYLTLHTTIFCEANGIILLALHPKANHLMEPMEITVFQTLNNIWSRNLQNTCNHSPFLSFLLNKLEFPSLLKKTLEEISPETIQEGFKKSGLVPWNSKVLDTEFMFFESERTNTVDVAKENVQELKAGLDFLEKYIEKEKIEEFKSSKEWKGNPHDIGLFNLWKKTDGALRSLNFYGYSYDMGSLSTLQSNSMENIIEVEDTS